MPGTKKNMEEDIGLKETFSAPERSTIKQNKGCCCKKSTMLWGILWLSLVICFIAYIFYTTTLNRDVLDTVSGSSQSSPLLDTLTGGVGNKLGAQNRFLDVGVFQNFHLKQCRGGEYKQSFPDLDYALLGYNVLKGYPLSVGHDPGFTYPIFVADYSKGKQTADCRYSIPEGLLVVPDVSCETSFSSTVAQTKYEFASSLSTSANIGGGGWGVQFSASAGYKTSSSEIATGEYVYIISSATCVYYFSKLVKRETPDFHPVFLDWIRKLSDTDDKSAYLEFFEFYGTHFPTTVTFGARFTYEHKMKSELYETKRESQADVAVQASYSGAFSVSGGFGMSYSDRNAASEFSKSVQTRTITTGAAPPSNGDAMTWASTVKDSPVPIKYKLESIENLFTNDYMPGVGVNKRKIATNIRKYKQDYCQSLKDKGQVSSCASLTAGIQLMKTRLFNHYQTKASTLSDCIDHCLKQIHCSAISYCTSCSSNSPNYKICFVHRSDSSLTGSSNSLWESHIFLEKVKRFSKVLWTAVKGTPRALEDSKDRRANFSRCQDLCLTEVNCVAFSYCDSQDRTDTCELYGAPNIYGLIPERNTTTTFVSPRARQPRTSPLTSVPTKNN